MLTKSVILQELSKAKIAHMRWVKRADHLISGLPVDKEFIPLEATTCGFGKWLYGDIGSKLRVNEKFKHLIEQIEFHHDNLHDVYSRIYTIYFVVPQKRSLLYKIVTFNRKEVSKKEQEEAKKYFESLKRSSEELLALLDRFEYEVKNASSFTELNELV
jgi:hypothetical protein